MCIRDSDMMIGSRSGSRMPLKQPASETGTGCSGQSHAPPLMLSVVRLAEPELGKDIMTSASQEGANTYSLWSDAETEVDLLGFTHLVDAVERLVRSQHLLPATIGVFGDWGSGKSSVLKMAAKRLEVDEGTLVLWFNGWLFEGYDQAKASLMERLVDELVDKRCTSAKMKKLAIRLFRRINWLRAAGTTLKVGGAFALGGPPTTASSTSTFKMVRSRRLTGTSWAFARTSRSCSKRPRSSGLWCSLTILIVACRPRLSRRLKRSSSFFLWAMWPL